MKNLFYLLCLVALLSCKTSTEELIPDPEIVNSISKFEVIKDPNVHLNSNSKIYLKNIKGWNGDLAMIP